MPARKPTTKPAPRKTRSERLKTPQGESAATERLNLKAAVKGKAVKPEKMISKGSFLWVEAIPKTVAAARRLADKGRKLLAKYSRSHFSRSKTA